MTKQIGKARRPAGGDETLHPAEAVHRLHAKSDGSTGNKQYRQTLRENFAQRLIALIRQQQMTQAELARKAGLERYHITDYTTARRYPRPGQLVVLADALGVSVDDLRPQPVGVPLRPKLPQFSMASDDQGSGGMRVQLDTVVSIETALKIGELLKDEKDAASHGD